MAKVRQLVSKHRAFHTVEGDGFDVQRAIPNTDYESVGPFIFLDHFGPIAYRPGEAKGASSHPHAGIETLTLLLEGRMRHKDSLGNESTMAPGDVQWMRAGRGIVHDEQPDTQAMSPGDTTHGVQLWINLPRGGKHDDPIYRHVNADEIPLVPSRGGHAKARLVIGSIGDHVGPIDTVGAPIVVHASFGAADTLDLDSREVRDLAVYVMRGVVRLGEGGDVLGAGELGWATPGEVLELNAETGTELLVIGGEPLDAPIFRYGPFVMNSVEDLQRAVRDFQAGRMGWVEPSVVA